MSDVMQFGMFVIGDEILCGKRTDKHLPHVIEVLQARGMQIAWSTVVGDHRQRLVHELQLSQLGCPAGSRRDKRAQADCRLTRSQATNACLRLAFRSTTGSGYSVPRLMPASDRVFGSADQG